MNKLSRFTFEQDTMRIVVRVELREKEPCAPGLTIDLEPVPGGAFTELSICCDIYEQVRGRWRDIGGGQAHEELSALFGDRPGVARLVELWERWHLNGMCAGTRSQQDFLWEHPITAVYPASHYELALEALAAAGLSPDRGYKYGQSWLVELLPEAVLNELAALSPESFRLPETAEALR